MKTYKKIFLTIFCILIIGILVCYSFKLQNVVMRELYPQKYSEYVNKYADKYNIDPLLIFAIIKAESNFNLEAKSNNNAKGLMQIMENTAKELANDDNIDLYDSETNIKLGTIYISILLEKYDNNIGIALAAYNAGMGNVNTWIERGIINADGSNLENIPYKETNMYVRKILNSYEVYKKLYS